MGEVGLAMAIGQIAGLCDAIEEHGARAGAEVITLGVLGGSFSPPHVGHVLVAQAALALGRLDGLVVIPAFSHAFGKGLAPFGHRLAMTRLAYRDLASRVVVSDLERHLPRPSFTVNTLRCLVGAEGLRGRVHWRLLIGSDVAGDFQAWKEPEELKRLARPLVVQRAGQERANLPDGLDWLGNGVGLLPEISSTDIRRDLLSGDMNGAGGLVPWDVLDYIRVHRLEGMLGT